MKTKYSFNHQSSIRIHTRTKQDRRFIIIKNMGRGQRICLKKFSQESPAKNKTVIRIE